MSTGGLKNVSCAISFVTWPHHLTMKNISLLINMDLHIAYVRGQGSLAKPQTLENWKLLLEKNFNTE